jgi:hypothetical protein
MGLTTHRKNIFLLGNVTQGFGLGRIIWINDQVKEEEIGSVCSMHGETRTAYRILVVKPEGKRPLGRTRCRSEDTVINLLVP